MASDNLLKKHNLAGMNMSGMSLGGCDFSGKNMRGVDLSFAHLGCANLRGTDLRNANFHSANLGAADFTGADLRYADLRNTNLTGAVLIGADFRESLTDESCVSRKSIRLEQVLGLQETDAFSTAKDEGFFPFSHWASSYYLEDGIDEGKTLNRCVRPWKEIKRKLGALIFGDRETYNEVRLVQQYKNYSQWAYMITDEGFRRIMNSMGLKIAPKE